MPSVSLSFFLSDYISFWPPLMSSVYLSACISVYLSAPSSWPLSICLSVFLSIFLPPAHVICLSVRLSFWPLLMSPGNLFEPDSQRKPSCCVTPVSLTGTTFQLLLDFQPKRKVSWETKKGAKQSQRRGGGRYSREDR